jgi:predicted phosphatase
LPIDWVNRIFNSLNIKKHFQELLAFENWSKVENINYIIKKHNIKPKDILFIEDNINHINSVNMTGVNTLHFIDYDIDIEKQIEIINNSK